MRTTVTLDRDVAAALARIQRERGIGVSAALNELVRKGLAQPLPAPPFVQRTSSMRARIDVTDVAEALDLLEGPAAR